MTIQKGHASCLHTCKPCSIFAASGAVPAPYPDLNEWADNVGYELARLFLANVAFFREAGQMSGGELKDAEHRVMDVFVDEVLAKVDILHQFQPRQYAALRCALFDAISSKAAETLAEMGDADGLPL